MKTPKKPKVSFRFVEEGREIKAVCKLCGSSHWAYSRSSLYVSTAHHKESCPKLAEWKEECRRLQRLDLEAQM